MIEEIKNSVMKGKIKLIESVVQNALDAGNSPADILDSMMLAMDEIGVKFQNNEIYVPEMLVAAKTMQKGTAVLKPLLGSAEIGKNGKFIIGTAEGDRHDIGKHLVSMMVESAGFEVVDLGVEVSPERFVEAIKANPDCKVVGISALLTTTMEAMRNTVKAIRDAGLDSQVKIMVGGAPITKAFADEIGADAYTPDAGSAAAVAKELIA